MTITLQLGAFRARSEVDRRAISDGYFKAVGYVHDGVAKRILGDIGTALTASTAPTVGIDVSGATTADMLAVCARLVSAGQVMPIETPPDWLRQFIRDAETSAPELTKRRRMDGFPAV